TNTLAEPGDTGETAGTTTAGLSATGQHVFPWQWIAAGFAGLWVLTLAWALQRRARPVTRSPLSTTAHEPPGAMSTHTLADLRRALDSGDLAEVGEVLRGMSMPPSADLDALVAKLDSPQQRNAVAQLRRARWADGDGVAARAALREAFAKGPLWRSVQSTRKEVLPPLYPPR
ncbi:MAG: protein BatD, partial [Pseudoxanthomonas sp.]